MNRLDLDYTVTIRQQPQQGRMCGMKEAVDRRVLDPPLILQLHFNDPNREKSFFNRSNSLLCHLTLFDPERHQNRSITQDLNSDKKQYQKIMLGDDPVTAQVLIDPFDHQPHLFFIFSKLSIRFTGKYSICCNVIDLASQLSYQIFTKVFEVYSSKGYPGMLESTAISKAFKMQGVSIFSGHRKKVR
ncbi:velvet factor [Globomyces pollinis-pini]|nr:velvet factor [Globomyces pollinis-pini]